MKPKKGVTQKGSQWKCDYCGRLFNRAENAVAHIYLDHVTKVNSSNVQEM